MTRKIRTAAELDALPARSIVRLATGHAAYRGTGSWVSTDGDGPPIEYDIDRILPATVLHDPSAPAPAPSVVPEAAVEAAASAVRKERAFSAAAAFGVPIDDVPHCAEMIARAALTAALPLLTAAPSATRDEVARAMFAADPAHRHGADEFDRLRALGLDVTTHYATQADALLARFNITPKEDR